MVFHESVQLLLCLRHMSLLKECHRPVTLEQHGGLGAPTPLHGQKSASNFRLPPDITTGSLPSTRSLTDDVNRGLTRILYGICFTHCILTIKYAGKKY